jgi:hypothetical protein
MRGKSVKEGYGGEGGLREVILREVGGLILGELWICREEWSFGVGLYQSGTGVAGGFGHGGQDIHMISWS